MKNAFRLLLFAAFPVAAAELEKDTGYRGIWYFNQPSQDEYVYKYSGGFATYPQQQSPIAIYAPEVAKTFFCYGGAVPGRQELLYMVSYYDHRTGQVPRPRILLNKRTEDAHDNPVMALDGAGRIWIFGNSHGTSRPSPIFRSTRPYSVDAFEKVWEGNFSYGHPRWLPPAGFFFLHTRYERGGRSLYWMTSEDGVSWQAPKLLARAEAGHYQITAQRGARVASVFNLHPPVITANGRTNLYYVESGDRGRTWTTASGQTLAIPITSPDNPALVYDYRREGLLVYLKNVEFDAAGHPVILYLTSRGYESGPKHGPRQWWTARWTGRQWEILPFTTSDHNYDYGALAIAPSGEWRILAPTEPGPQPWTTGGEMVLWSSRDQGRTWNRLRQLTRLSPRNHTYARTPLNAHSDFYWLWADGDTKKPSESSLYFTDRAGSAVWRLPVSMTREFAQPEKVPMETASARYAIGADLSFLKQAEDQGVVFKDNGMAKPGLQIFKDHGYNWIRLRLFHTPTRLPNNLQYTIALAKSAKALGYQFLLDFHYSDTWADPGKQFIPKAWEGKSPAELAQTVRDYSRDSLIAFGEAGVFPEMVQIGNEITNGMLWPTGKLPENWDHFAALVQAGIDGVKAASAAGHPRPNIMIQIEKGGNRAKTKEFFDKLHSYGIDYDIQGQSYYPWWHGSLLDLRETLHFMANEYRKPIIVVEAAYNWKPGEYLKRPGPFPESPEGQKEYLEEVNRVVLGVPHGLGQGVFWWEPAVTGPLMRRGFFDDNYNALPVITVFDKFTRH